MLHLILVSALALNPEELLTKAISMVEMCGYEKPEKYTLDSLHQKVGIVAEKKKDDDPTQKISLPILFRQGRYQLEDGGHAILEQREVSIVNFYPLPEKQMLKPQGNEDGRFSRAMNFLSGSVFIDKETGGIIRVETKLFKEVPYEKFFIKLFRVHELNFTFSQVLMGSRWVPDFLRLEWHGRSKAGLVNYHELYYIDFTCTDSQKASP